MTIRSDLPIPGDSCVLRVFSRQEPPVLHVHVEGEVDADTTALLAAELTRAIEQCPLVCCDLSQVRFFGAAGANLLAAAGERATGLGHRLELRGAHGMTRQVLEIAGLDRVLPVSG